MDVNGITFYRINCMVPLRLQQLFGGCMIDSVVNLSHVMRHLTHHEHTKLYHGPSIGYSFTTPLFDSLFGGLFDYDHSHLINLSKVH
jgi:hypothetical protein